MNHGEMAVLMKGIAPVIEELVKRAVQPVADRLVQLEKREPPEGKPGKDGFSLDDFDANVSEDGRTIIMSFGEGEKRFEAEMKFPVPLYRNVFKEGEQYDAGDMVTWGGSVWHCREATTEKPDVGPWTLAVKKGRDGKSV